MTKFLLPGFLLLLFPFIGNSQCSTTNATSCACLTSGSSNCYLLPDMIVARPPLLVSGSNGVIEYSQSGNGADNGRLRLSVSTPNIGHGPLEVRTTDKYICGTDTIVGTAPTTCVNTGLPPKQLVVQRVYQKTGNTMSYFDRDAGTMTYHPSHGHMHVDDWGIYTLRTQSNDPNPLNWPIIGTGAKLAFCLMDYGSCSTYNGHCVDSLGNTLLNANFPNYGLGGGTYNCSPIVQGISSGYTDIYYQSLDGMWIDIPPGTCNGTYYIVVQLDPYNYFLEENENNNVLVVPYTLTQQVINSTATITSNATGANCSGTPVTLTANTGSGYTYLWSNGQTTSSISVTTPGNYAVTVTTSCGVATSAPYAVSFVGATPTTTGASVCNQGSATLIASAPGSTVKWYAAATGGTSLFTGNNFVTPSASNTTSYYAEATTTAAGFSGYSQPNTNAFGTGGFFTSSQYLIFNALQNFTLASVKVYAQTATSTTVELRTSLGALLNTVTVSIPSGESRITLNWPVAAGTDLRLTRSGTASLYRNNAGATYPYTIPGYLSITNSSAGSAFYYFFYDWEITLPALTCVSARVPATLTVNPNPVVALANFSNVCSNAPAFALTGGSPTNGTYSGTGVSNNMFNPASSGVGTFPITYTYTNGTNCTSSDVKNITVSVCTCAPPAQPAYVQGAAKPCPGNTVTYSTPLDSTVTSWNWNIPSGITLLSGQGTNTVSLQFATNFSSATICVTAINICGNSLSKCKLLSKSVAAKPAAVLGELSGNCTQTTNLSVAPVGGAVSYTWSLPSNSTNISGQGTSSISFNTPASFNSGQVCVTSFNGCVNSASRCVTIYGAPAQSPILGPVSVCSGQQNVSYSVVPVYGATSYTWSLPSGTTFVSGQGTNSIVVNIGNIAGQVGCKIKNTCGNRGTSKLTFNINCRLAEYENFNVYPNPATDKFEIDFNSIADSKSEIQLSDITGRIIYSEIIKTSSGFNHYILNVASFSKGPYFLNVIQPDNTLRTKVIIQ